MACAGAQFFTIRSSSSHTSVLGLGILPDGQGKLMDIEKPTEFFQSLGIPFPHTQAILVGTTECVGGLLLLLGLASRVISIPLTILLVVAYLTADLEIAKNIFNNPDKFLAADEFLFLFAVVLVLVFGPGKFSIDWIVRRKIGSSRVGSTERSQEDSRANHSGGRQLKFLNRCRSADVDRCLTENKAADGWNKIATRASHK